MKKFSKSFYIFIILTLFAYSTIFLLYDKQIFELVSYSRDKFLLYQKRYQTEFQNRFNFNISVLSGGKDLKSKKKLIVMWYPEFTAVSAPETPHQNCHVTYDRSAISEADAVVFHCAELPDSPNSLPISQRQTNQRWVWWCREPPWNTRFVFRKSLTELNGVFNWTFTYRLDSDILSSYGGIIEPTNNISNVLANKKKQALGAWVVSNCAASKRGEIIKELSHYFKIDTFGRCVNRPLCQGSCMIDVLSQYKFYFSFENSECKDYITEKFWKNALKSQSVPVVLGGFTRKDYEKTAPDNSFIHINDFSSLKDLADYLKSLADDEEKYRKYLYWTTSEGVLQWKMKLRRVVSSDHSLTALSNYVQSNFSDGFHTLCSMLHQTPKPQIVEHLDTWWYGSRYTKDSKSFSVCQVDSGPSGRPLGWLVTLVYSLVFLSLTFLIGCRLFY